MPQSPSSPSRYLCRTDLRAALAGLGVALVAACGGDDSSNTTCGPGSAAADGLVATGSGSDSGAVTLTYGNLAGGLNNDCPAADAPSGIVSLTIEGTQTDGSGDLTLCISRPDQLATGSLALGPDAATSAVRLIDFTGTGGGSACTFTASTTAAPSGTVRSTGLCKDGSDAAGFALTLTATIPVTSSCGDTLTVSLAGTASVASMQ